MAAATQILGNWRRAQAVCFDVDSTVTVGEGIDELADFCGVGEVVAQWRVTPQSDPRSDMNLIFINDLSCHAYGSI